MLFNAITGVLVSGGPYLSGMWFMGDNTPLRVSFDPASSYGDLSVSTVYGRTFSIFNDGFLAVSYRGLSVALEGRFANLEGDYSGTASEVAATVGYSYEVIEGFRLGLSSSLYQINTPREDLKRMQTFALHGSANFRVYDRWRIGLFAKNVNSPEIGGIALPVLLGGYITFLPKSTVRTGVGVMKDQYSPAINFGLGGSWDVNEVFGLRASMRYDGRFPTFYMGFRVGLSDYSTEFLAGVHPELPTTLYASVNYGLR